MLQHWIWLSARRGLGTKGKAALLERFQEPEAVYFAARGDYAGLGLPPNAVESLLDKELDGARKILADCDAEQIHILTIHDGVYPDLLKNIPDPPVVLYCKGRLPDLDGTPAIGVVGTRKASLYGLKTAKSMGYQIAACGGIVVSGMADGIDAMAMQGALTAGMSVVGVLGCGVDIVYPPRNRSLFADTERYGCILSEYPPGTPPLARHFPVRNRIISGMSDGVLVVEAPEKSGALITAEWAADQGRDVFVIPGNIDVDSGAGSNALLRDGGIPVRSGWDVVSEYASRYPGRVTRGEGGARLRTLSPERAEPTLKVAQKGEKITKKSDKTRASKKKVIDNSENEPYSDLTKKLSLTQAERDIAAQLAGGKKLVDDVIAQSELPAAQVLSSLTMLEIKGVVRRLPGRYVTLSGEK